MIELADNTQAAPPAVQLSLLDQLLDTLVQRVAAQVEGRVSQRITALETQLNTATLAATPITTTGITEERIKQIADEVARDVMSEHYEVYDHMSYDNVVNKLDDYDLDDFVSESDIEEKVESAVRDLTSTVSVE